ncbi:MAG: hypothetical protein KME43_06805 [Myxacorys chilensis ATA2-1-KO14]|jgi:hypothetical protein|nr:hypothetical protein [Myxacorys chilensis ATA2-1-KO14]
MKIGKTGFNFNNNPLAIDSILVDVTNVPPGNNLAVKRFHQLILIIAWLQLES